MAACGDPELEPAATQPSVSASPSLSPSPVPTLSPTPTAVKVPTTQAPRPPKPSKSSKPPERECHPSYSACLPITTDLDCGEISQRNFRVLGSDPYRLDADNDGIACES